MPGLELWSVKGYVCVCVCVCVCEMGHVSDYGKECVCEHALCQNDTIYYFYLCWQQHIT